MSNTIMQITAQGQYHESSQPSVDPSKVNDFSKKLEQELKPHPDIERKSTPWRDVWDALSQYHIPDVRTPEDNRQHIQDQHADLVAQCNLLKELVQGLIVGDRNALAQEQQYKYIESISHILKDLSEIEMSESYRLLAHSIKHAQPNNQQLQKQLQQTISQIKHDEQVPLDQPAVLEVAVQETDQTLLDALSKRLQRIEKYIGLNQLTQVGKGRDFTLNFRGQPIISSQNVLEGKSLTFKPQDHLSLTNYTQQIPQPEAMPILQHIKYLSTALDIINGNDAKFDHILTPQEICTNMTEALDVGKKYEVSLIAGDEIPTVVERLQSLQTLHDESLQLPEEVDRIQSDLLFMEQSLRVTDELLDLLEKDITENIIILKENISKLKQ